MPKLSFPVTFLFLLGLTFPSIANAPEVSTTEQESGVQRLEGKGYWTNFEIPLQYTDPVVVLLDRGALWAKRQANYSTPSESQIFGTINSDLTNSPFTFSLDLPKNPQGEFHDVDNNRTVDPGVQIWGVLLANNPIITANEPNLTPVEQLTHLSLQVSSVISQSPTTVTSIAEPKSGTLIVYSETENQGFPQGFGPDGLLFTKDDPIATLEPGYTVVHLNAEGFIFERSPVVEITLQERPEDSEVDLSQLSYTEAFNRLIDLLKSRYAYTQLRSIDWEMWRKEYILQVSAAQRNRSPETYFSVLNTLTRRMQDAHVQVYPSMPLIDVNFDSAIASLGIDPIELSNKRIVAQQILPESPAAQAGILPFAEIIAINEIPIQNRIEQLVSESALATPVTRRLEAVSRSLFFPPDTAITLRYRNPNQTVQTVTLTSEMLAYPTPYQFLGLPYQTVTSPSNRTYGYGKWTSFMGDRAMLTELTEFIQMLNQRRIPGLILDLRHNGGGSVATLAQLITYFWHEENPLYLNQTMSQRFNLDTQEVVTFSSFEIPQTLPLYAPEPNAYYGGEIVILVSSECASACEFFSDWMQRYKRATIIGSHSTQGAGGSVTIVPLPENITFTYTYTQELDLDQNPYLEARGVQPDILVPITEDFIKTQMATKDPVLEAALNYLDNKLNPTP
ncbi:MAG: S41 family peptidase [Jaaginema sp. PMC 1079.18]|nr:S41 family peptidase [Jaaginema sp. PMC 1080.18]MEC4850462.1 S41 family peptidase [Jaaginema sp. PMC 1079.18]MEC4866587.1 S41 family peptidase [Jaaginema sp. PMC 1078.18]